MIEGVLGSFFSDNHTSEDLRKAYSRVWQHLAADTLDSEDLRRISSAVDFAMKNQFCESCKQRKPACSDNGTHQVDFRTMIEA